MNPHDLRVVDDSDERNHGTHFEDFMSETLGVPSDFFLRLGEDDDWAFVIKSHALLEASLNHLLIKRFGDDRLKDLVSTMDTSDRRRGKLGFIVAMELLPKAHTDFISLLSALRNKLVHHVTNLGFCFEAYFAKLDSNQRKNWSDSLTQLFNMGLTIELEGTGKVVDREQIIAHHPRLAITLALQIIMSTVLLADLARTHDPESHPKQFAIRFSYKPRQ
jgi:hypothetical protein